MRRDAQGVVLLVLGAALLKLCVTGSYARYVRAGMAPALLLTALALMLLGAVALRQTMSARRAAATDPRDDSATGPDSSTVESSGAPVRRAGWPLLATALVALLLVPPAAGGYQAARTAAAVVTSSATQPLSATDPVRLSLHDFVVRAADHDGASLRNRVLTLTGFVLLAPDGRPYLARMTMGCCAADARPIEVGLIGNLPDGVATGQWIEVDGGYVDLRDRDPVSGAVIPYLQVTAARAVVPPVTSYE